MKFLINKFTSYRWISCFYQSEVFFVAESTTGKESKSTKQENPEDETGSESVETSFNWVFILLIVLMIITLSVGCLIVFYCRWKKRQARSFSFVLTEATTHWLKWHFRPKSFNFHILSVFPHLFLGLSAAWDSVLSCYIIALYTVCSFWMRSSNTETVAIYLKVKVQWVCQCYCLDFVCRY